jgi:photosystem II stability/assembly factor-like uncharacterized protein
MTDHRSPGRSPARRLLGCALSAIFVWVACGVPAGAAPQTGGGTAQQPRFVDKRLGEEDQIRRRTEWFYSTRRAGTSSDQEMWSLRLAAVEETRQAIARQRARQTTGFEAGQNVWVEMGPSPSTFGNWAFGNVSGRIQAIAADWSGGVLYLGAASGGVWKSTNDGASWTSIFDTAGTLAIGAIHVDPNDPQVIWVGTGDNIVGCESYFGIGLLRSPDGGTSWELRNGSGSNTLEDLASFASITIDPRDSNRIVTGGKYRGCASGSQQSGGIYTSHDGGATWTNRLANTQVYEIARDPVVLDILWAATQKGVYKSEDNGATWILQTNSGLPSGNLSRTEIAIAPSEPGTIYVLFDTPSDQFWRTTDGGASWSLMNPDACDGQCWYNMVIRVDPFDRNVVYRGTIRPHKSVNGGSNWTVLTAPWGGSQQVHQDIHSLLMHPTEPDTFYIGGDGGLWKSENGGSSFINLNGNLNVTQFYAIGVDANDPGRICGGAQDNSSLATDNDVVWDRQAVTGDGFVCHINPVNPNYAYITSYPSGGYPNVWRATNGLFGSFSDITGPGSGVINGDRSNWVTPYILDPTSPNILYLGTHRAYRSDNHGTSWTQVGPGDLTGGGGSSLLTLEVNRNFPLNVYTGSTAGAVWRTTDGGTNWSNITSGLPPRSINDIAGDPTNPDRAFATVGGFNTAHVWEWDGLAGWSERGGGLPNVPANTVLMLSDTDILVGMDTGIFRSMDGGQTFLPYMAGLPEGLVVTDLKYNEQQQMVTAGTYGRGTWQTNIGPLQPILLADGVELPLGELDGDADGRLEPGETWRVRPILHNAGGVAAVDVSARFATSTPGVTILAPDTGSFGDLGPGVAAPVQTAFEFVVDPSFACGDEIVFDLVDITSATPSGIYDDQPGFYPALVRDQPGSPITTTLFDEDFDPIPPSGWTHELPAGLFACAGVTYRDEWNLTSKDAAHGTSYHCGNGPGDTYQTNYAWLHPGGKDSEGGVGLEIPDDATAAALTLVHWYDTIAGEDGGQVAIDAVKDGQDVYTTLEPIGGYPGILDTGNCNRLEGQPAFQGSSGGWVTSVFDLTPFMGEQVYLTFVFASDRNATGGEGWYIDEVTVEFQQEGEPVCDIAPWPGVVQTAHFSLLDVDTIEASWSDACNIAVFPDQTYSIQAGDLDTLITTGTYTHMPVGGSCDLASPHTFTPGPDDEYYLVVPVSDGREGSAGTDSAGTPRPQPGLVCGERRVAACP